MDLEVKVLEIRGRCPVYQPGDNILIREGYILDSGKGTDICMHSLASLMPYYVALSHGVSPAELGLAGVEEGKAYLQCLDPCEVTGGGTVLFEVSPCTS